MKLRKILTIPDKRLRKIAAPVECFDTELQHLVEDMFASMYEAKGIGLAATQINVHYRVIVMDVAEPAQDEQTLPRPRPLTLINPELLEQRGKQIYQEGCLSVPECYAEIERAEWVRIRAHNLKGEVFEMEAEGLLAVCIQHEMDHLQGVLFIDYLSPLKRERFLKKVNKINKQTTNA